MKGAPEKKSPDLYIVACKTYDEAIGGRGYYDSFSVKHSWEDALDLYESLKDYGPVFGCREEVLIFKGEIVEYFGK